MRPGYPRGRPPHGSGRRARGAMRAVRHHDLERTLLPFEARAARLDDALDEARHVVRADDDDSDPGSMSYLFANFQRWQPAKFAAAAAGLEGTVLEDKTDWEAMQSAHAAVAHGMRQQQHALLPADAWSIVASLMDETAELPPRRVERPPPPARHDAHGDDHARLRAAMKVKAEL